MTELQYIEYARMIRLVVTLCIVAIGIGGVILLMRKIR